MNANPKVIDEARDAPAVDHGSALDLGDFFGGVVTLFGGVTGADVALSLGTGGGGGLVGALIVYSTAEAVFEAAFPADSA